MNLIYDRIRKDMEITGIRLENFLSVKDKQSIDFDKFSTIVGPNDSGKTNLFRTIAFVGDVLKREKTVSNSYYYQGNLEKTFRVEVDVKFSPDEKEIIYNFLMCSSYLTDPTRQSNEVQDVAKKLNVEIVKNNGKKFFQNFIDSITIIIIGTGQEHYRIESQFRIMKNNETINIIQGNQMSLYESKQEYNQNYTLGSFLYNEFRKKHESLVSKLVTDREIQIMPNTKMQIDNAFDYTLKKLRENESSRVSFNHVQMEEFERRDNGIPIEAKRLRKFLFELEEEQYGLSFDKLISLIYNNSIIRTSNIRTQPQASINERNNLKLIERLRDFSGKDLALILFDLKNSNNYNHRKMFADIKNAFDGIFDNTTFDVGITSSINKETKTENVGIPVREITHTNNYNDPNTILAGTRNITREYLSHELFIQITRGKLTTSLEYSAAGIFDALYVLTCILGHKNKCILLDEPALNLHPNLQRKILNHISNTIKDNKNQVILVTHSPYLVNTEQIENTWRVIRESDSTKIINIGKSLLDIPKDNRKKIMIRLGNSEVRSLLFSKGVVLVEGSSDKLVFQRLDQKLSETDSGPKLDENEWTVLDMGGKEHLQAFLTLVNLLRISYVGIVDSDAIMKCSNYIPINGEKIRTSTVPYAIFRSRGLSDDEISKLKKMNKTIKSKIHDGKKILEYNLSQRKNLEQFCNKYNILTLKKDLEHVLKSQIKRGESKPLKALENILYRTSKNKIPKELLDTMNFIKSKM